MKEKIKNAFNKDNLFYTLIFIISMLVIIVNRILVGFPPVLWLCDIGSVFSILYTINMAKHNVYGFIFNIIATAVMVITGYYQHIWLNATVCLCINIPSMVIGLVGWLKNERAGKQEDNLKSMNKKTLYLMITLSLVVAGVFTYILYLLDGNLFYIDGIFSALCVMGVVLASKMYIEQYYFFMPANIIGVILYVVLCFQDMSNLPYVVTNIIFTIVSFMGYANWKRLSHAQNCKNKNCENCSKNDKKPLKNPLFSEKEIENAIINTFGEDNCYYNNDNNLTIHKRFLNTFSATDHWCECEVSVTKDVKTNRIYLSDCGHTLTNYANEGVDFENASYYSYVAVLKKLKEKYPHIEMMGGEFMGEITSLDKESLLSLASDVVSVTHSVWYFMEEVINRYQPCEEVGEGEFKELSLANMVKKLRDEGLLVEFDSGKRLYYIKKKKRYFLIYDDKGYKFSTLHYNLKQIEKGKPQKVEYDFKKFVSALKLALKDKFDEGTLSYTTFTYVNGAPLKFYLTCDKYGVYFSDRKWAKFIYKSYDMNELTLRSLVGYNNKGEVVVPVSSNLLDESLFASACKDLIYDLEITAIKIKDLDVYTLENVGVFNTRLFDIDEIEYKLNCLLSSTRMSDTKIEFRYDCPFCEKELVFYLEKGSEYCSLKFDSYLQGDNFDIFARRAKEKNILFSKAENCFYYNVLGKSTFVTQKECYTLIEFLLLHNFLERVEVTIEGGSEKPTKEFINECVEKVINKLKPIFRFEVGKNGLIYYSTFRPFVTEIATWHELDDEFGSISFDKNRITSSIVEKALKTHDEKLVYLINKSNYNTKPTKENYEALLKEAILLTFAVKNLM